MSSFTTILVEFPLEGVTCLTLNRPHRLNALNATMLNELVVALRENAQSRVIILTGAGERSFCAGEDLKEGLAPVTGSAEELRGAFDRLQDLTRLTSMASPLVVAAVQGYAVGGGAEIALGCDFVIGGPNTVFRFPEVSIGLAATGGITARLTSIVGLLKAKELLIRGLLVEADEASRIGLLTELVNDPKARALELAKELAALPSISARQSKMSLERGTFPNMEAALQDEINTASVCFAQAESAKAMSDFAARKDKNVQTATSAATNEVKSRTFEQVTDLNRALDRAADSDPMKVFLRFTRPFREVTYCNFHQTIMKMASGLYRAGIRTGHRVVMMMRTCLEAVELWFALNRLGAVWVPINTELKSLTLKSIIKSANAKLAVVEPDFYELIHETTILDTEAIYASAPVPNYSSAKVFSSIFMQSADNEPLTPSPIHPSTTSALLFTSGTTGGAKACILSHAYFIHAACNISAAFNFTSTDVLYCPFPLFHGDATSLTIIPALLNGAAAALSPRFSVSRFWDEIRETKATVYDFMGATLGLLYKAPPSPRDRENNVRLAWGVPVPSWASEYEKRFSHQIVEVYGSTETGLPVAQRINHSRIQGSCGTVVPESGYTLRIADEYDNPISSPTATGHLLLRSDTPRALFDGYFGADQATAEAFRGTWFHTGDLARLDEKGNLFFAGRSKDVIRRRGEMISAFLVEEELLANPAVKLCAAIGVPSSLGEGAEEDVKVAVVLAEGFEGTTEEEVWRWCKERMPRFLVPGFVEIMEEGALEVTETGKVKKIGLDRSMGGARGFDLRKSD